MMEKYVNKKGFTLVELIIVIAIVAALSISMGVSTIETLKETRIKDSREKYVTLLNAAKLYGKLKSPVALCSKDSSIVCNACGGAGANDMGNPCEIPLCCLASSGLIDEDVFNTMDPVLSSDDDYYVTKSIEEDSINFYLKQKAYLFYYNGVMHTAIKNRNCNDYITDSEIEGQDEYIAVGDYLSWEGQCIRN